MNQLYQHLVQKLEEISHLNGAMSTSGNLGSRLDMMNLTLPFNDFTNRRIMNFRVDEQVIMVIHETVGVT